MKTTPLVIFGAGGFAREVLQIALDINAQRPTWELAGFVVDESVDAPPQLHGLPVFKGPGWLEGNPDAEVVIAIGSPSVRRRIAMRIGSQFPNAFARLVHPRAWLGRQVSIGAGTVVCAGALITTDITLGCHVHVNIGCTVGHDSTLGDFVTLNPSVNVSGNVQVGTGVEVGTGSILIPHANVGDWSIVGAGSVVTKPLDGNVTAVGAPARTIKTRLPGWHEGTGS